MNIRSLSLSHVAFIALIICVLLFWANQNQTPIMSRWPGSDIANPPPTIGAVALPAADASLLNLTLSDGLYAGERSQIDADTRRAYSYVAGRFGSPFHATTTVAFLSDNGCALSGIAYTDIRKLQVYTCDGIGRGRAVAILAHEYVHQLQHDRYGDRHLGADLILSEGMATWAAGDYWLGGQPNFRAYVRAQRAGGAFYPLATHYAGLGVDAMNTLYYQWAAFVEFLVDVYGRDRLDQVYVTGAGAPGSADYRAVYGKDLAELEREWLTWLDR